MNFDIIHKPTFTNQLLAIPKDRAIQIIDKIRILQETPQPHEPQRKKLHGYKGDIYRLRSGDYRVIYTYGDGWVALLGVDDRKDVYRGGKLVTEEPTVDIHTIPDLDAALQSDSIVQATPTKIRSEDPMYLPTRLDDKLLVRLHIPEEFWATLRMCKTVEDLIVVTLPEDLRERVFNATVTPDFDRVIDQPSYVTGDIDDLLRFKEGELLGFLLKLSPEQGKFVSWGVNATGPTLVKGGPGTGKSTVALYRVQSLLKTLQRQSGTPRVLFTTYTNALISYSEQLLHSLLGTDDQFVEVRTADSVAAGITSNAGLRNTIAEPADLRKALQTARTSPAFKGNLAEQRTQARTIERLHPDYLLEEFESVIEGRELATLEDYLATPRAGRVVRLNATQRTAMWTVYRIYAQTLAQEGVQTWAQMRRRAVEVVRQGQGPTPYDAVVVDEAQDLDPTILRMLTLLCREPNRLFIAADANQSIYGSGFRWTDVHDRLRFQGRTGVLHTNYRSTREIGEAAQSYLGVGAIDDERADHLYEHSGPTPAIRPVATVGDEAQLLARFLPGAARAFRLGLNSCAVLTPSEKAGRAMADRLTSQGVEAVFMPGRDLDLTTRSVKVVTLKSAKGLEFPVVVLAGFLDGPYPALPNGLGLEEEAEALQRERRTMFVGMTRAMRALLVLPPAGRSSRLLQGFDARLWNVGS